MTKKNSLSQAAFGIAMLMLSVFISGCDVINPDEEIPSYIYIPSISLNTDYPTQGAPSHEINDAWVYVNDFLIGVFEVPATIPVNRKGPCKIEIRGGIRKNGQANNRIFYPFYTSYVKNTVLYPKTTDTLGPIVLTYQSNVNFKLLEGFDELSTRFEITKRSPKDTFITVTNPNQVFGGSGGSGLMEMQADTPSILEIATISEYNLPIEGSEVFVELDYKCDYQFTLGFIQLSPGEIPKYVSIISFYPTDSIWKKGYISFKEDIGSPPEGTKYKVFMGSSKPGKNYKPKMYIDNVKLLHFE